MEKTNETEISNLPNKEVKELVIKTLIQLENKWAPKCNKELESIKKKNQSNLKSTITEMETHTHTLQAISSRWYRRMHKRSGRQKNGNSPIRTRRKGQIKKTRTV